MSPRQRRGLLLLVLSLIAGILVFAGVLQYTADVSQQLGPRRDVLVVVRPATALEPLTADDVRVRSVPEVFSAPQSIGSVAELAGRVPRADLPVGAYVDDDDLIPAPALTLGQREVTLLSNAERTFGATIQVNDRVDVLVTRTTTRSGRELTATWRISGALVLGVTEGGGPAGTTVRLAVPQRQATRLAVDRSRGADVFLVRVPLAEVLP